jgi:hypothetical protein
MKSKILIVVNPEITGVEYHRQLIPHYHLNSQYKDDFEVHQINEIESVSDEFLSSFRLVQFSRLVSHTGKTQTTLARLKKLGIVSVLDIDDHWKLHPGHLLYHAYRQNKTSQQMLESVKYAGHITTTTSFFASVIQSVNANVTVLPNAIDLTQPQFEIQPKPSPKVRFGWVGGVCHLEDINLMKPGFARLNTDQNLAGKYQLYLMGFNQNDSTGIYPVFEKIFSANLTQNEDTYYRINAANVYSYAQGYNLFDVALAPLTHNHFNNCKSELKMIEAGFMKKAMIVSDVMPYKIIAKPGINCLAVKESAYKLSWYLNMKKLIRNPGLASDLAERLHEDITSVYHIDLVNKTRAELYKALTDKK